MTHKDSSFGHYIDRVNEITSDIKGKDKTMSQQNVSFVREFSVSDVEYFKRVLQDAEKINVNITWGFDEQQADPFHQGFTSNEFVRRLRRIVEGNPKTYEKKTTLEHSGQRPK